MEFLALIGNWVFMIIAGWIGFQASMKGHEKADKDATKRRIKQEEEELQSFIHAIKTEINILADMYVVVAGRFLKITESTEKSHLELEDVGFYFVANQDYFSIYHQNASMIGKIKNDSLRNLIVTTYSKAKQLVDAHTFHNMAIKDGNDFRIRYEEPLTSFAQEVLRQNTDILRKSSKKIVELNTLFQEDLQALNKAISSHSLAPT